MSGTKIVIDTDILSMFAKVGAMHILGALLGQGRIVMTPAIHDEITAPLQYGYTYPSEVLTQVPVAPLTEQIWREYERLWTLRPSLGKGELQAIAFCKAEGAFFVTNDRVARGFAARAVGAVRSILMPLTVALLVLPALSLTEALSDRLAPSPVMLLLPGQAPSMPDRASLHVQ